MFGKGWIAGIVGFLLADDRNRDRENDRINDQS